MKKIKTPKKIGRPKEDNPKNEIIKARIDSKLHDELLEYCKKEKIDKSEVVRRGVKLLLETDKKK
ncbi:TPA: CopG family transcriptional regulator [Clostridium perfringens]|uniref:CopG family transcriptional regulator n=1 Tax=Clostridium perfringens TaxID=1502 RepID=UPI001CB0F5FF|nr:CopG family transcriptional regulator [Clostridium perfringens]MDM0588417.1 CopG family transcriptional regulator [Clostridium perfringens]MDM0591469.1 CopG family transcriptional regulator [Clostridium perfringens]HBI6884208.1 CopG family transcriptional regulator [Clostridium perfringens]HBI6902026.1 CopG family transcriptional regulator [Clostridium perfringens]